MFLIRSVSVVAVAQLVEPWIVIPVVVGSSPISHPIFSRPHRLHIPLQALCALANILSMMQSAMLSIEHTGP